ncbi:MAG: DUF4173 domain-containing protein, partial [Chloroflexota bacterium]
MNLKHPLPILIIALLLGWATDQLFYGQVVGISFPIFVFLWLACLFGLGQLETIKPHLANMWLVVPLIFFALMVFVRANIFLTVVNIAACLGLLAFVSHFYAAGWVRKLGLIGYPIILVQTGLALLYRAKPLVGSGENLDSVREQTRSRLLPVFRGFLIAIPVLATFTCFLASADLVFASYVEAFFDLDFLDNVGELLWRTFLVLVIGWFLAGGFVYALSRQETDDMDHPAEKAIFQAGRRIPFGFIEGVTLLSLVNLLFLAFVAIQFTYLFGGLASLEATDYTYAEYARRGFFELIAVSLMTLGLILGLYWIMRRNSQSQEFVFNSLGTLMVALVIIMLISAFQRLLLYEAAFGYTELRLYSHVFMIWLALTLLWFLVTLWSPKFRFGIGALVAGFGFLITLNLINPDAFIARQNLAHFEQNGTFEKQSALDRYDGARQLDVGYLSSLS